MLIVLVLLACSLLIAVLGLIYNRNVSRLKEEIDKLEDKIVTLKKSNLQKTTTIVSLQSLNKTLVNKSDKMQVLIEKSLKLISVQKELVTALTEKLTDLGEEVESPTPNKEVLH